jgi:hypothetical protein
MFWRKKSQSSKHKNRTFLFFLAVIFEGDIIPPDLKNSPKALL